LESTLLLWAKKSDLVIELNDDRIKKSELNTLVASGGWGGHGIIHISAVGNKVLDQNSNYCIEIESSKDNCTSGTYTGSPIGLFHNNVEKATIPSKFEQFSFCLPLNYVNIENDQFKLHMKKRDGVCISSLRLNNKQILVGKNDDLSHFSFDNDGITCKANQMVTPLLTIKNGTVVSSICKGDNWVKSSKTNCWPQCGKKGGKCSFCDESGSEGFCCRRDHYHNGDCPDSAIAMSNRAHHGCIYSSK